MCQRQSIYLWLNLLFFIPATLRLDADDNESIMKYAYIRGQNGLFLNLVDGDIKFQTVRPGDRTTWDVVMTKEGCRIVATTNRNHLGIDPKKKVLALFDKPEPSTLWQIKAAGAQEIKPPRAFRALLFMKVGEDELRLSCDDMGNPILSGKADIIKFYIDGL